MRDIKKVQFTTNFICVFWLFLYAVTYIVQIYIQGFYLEYIQIISPILSLIPLITFLYYIILLIKKKFIFKDFFITILLVISVFLSNFPTYFQIFK